MPYFSKNTPKQLFARALDTHLEYFETTTRLDLLNTLLVLVLDKNVSYPIHLRSPIIPICHIQPHISNPENPKLLKN